MEIITRNYTVYNYSELSAEAKEVVKEWYIDDDIRTEIFSEDINYMLQEDFKNSNLKVQYSLGYRQGDGLNIYGDLCLSDIIDKINFDNFSEKEKKFILWSIKEYPQTVKLPYNHPYCYCIARQADFSGYIEYDLENCRMRDINYIALEKFDKACIEYFEKLCSEYEDAGYTYFYEPDETEICETCEANDWKFTADGKFFY